MECLRLLKKIEFAVLLGLVAFLYQHSLTPQPLKIPDLENQPTVAEAGFDWPPIKCSSPCVIHDSGGGGIDFFEAQGRQLLADKTPVIIDGPCLSACTILVDITREFVCLTPNAILGYHKSLNPNDDTTHEITYSTPGLAAYITKHGGEPEPNSGHMLMLNFNEAKSFYKQCRT